MFRELRIDFCWLIIIIIMNDNKTLLKYTIATTTHEDAKMHNTNIPLLQNNINVFIGIILCTDIYMSWEQEARKYHNRLRNKSFENIAKFRYLKTTVTSQRFVEYIIKRKIIRKILTPICTLSFTFPFSIWECKYPSIQH